MTTKRGTVVIPIEAPRDLTADEKNDLTDYLADIARDWVGFWVKGNERGHRGEV